MGARTRRGPAIYAVLGGALWALTPLRQPLLDAGRHPEEGELIFRGYNLLIVVIMILLTVALLRLRPRTHQGTAFTVGWWTVMAGHVLTGAGSLPAVLLGDRAPALVTTALDIGFLAALLTALGAIPLGASGLRRRLLPTPAAALFIMALPVGLLGAAVLAAVQIPEDYTGLPLTVLYGSAWIFMGAHWLQARHTTAASAST